MSRLNLMENNEKKIPSCSNLMYRSRGCLYLCGWFDDYENRRNYLTVVKHGVLYIKKSTLNGEELTVDTKNRSKVNFGEYGVFEKKDGGFRYLLRPSNQNAFYVMRAFLQYKNKNGELHYVYSDAVEGNVRGF